jgi:hypothetical protein
MLPEIDWSMTVIIFVKRVTLQITAEGLDEKIA